MTDWQNILLFVVVQIAMLVGLVGSLVPFFPGLFILWLAGLGFGLLHGWTSLGIVLFVIITLLFLFGTLVDNLMMGAGAYKGGARWWSILIALVAGVVGTILFPPFGGIIAAPIAVFVVEMIRLRNARRALKALTGMATGYGLSYIVRFGIGLLIMALWWLWAWKG
jgi:uncharacterized protein